MSLHRPARSLFQWMSDLTLLSPFELVSAACIDSTLNKFDTYVSFTSLLFIGLCALVGIVHKVRVSMLKPQQPPDEQDAQNGDSGTDGQTNPEQATEPVGEPVDQGQGDEPSPKTKEEIFSEHMGVFLLLTFLAYPNLSKIQFEALDCSTEFDGKTYLR